MKASVRIAAWLDSLERVDVDKQPAAAKILLFTAADPRPTEVQAAERALANLFQPGARIAYPPRHLDELLGFVDLPAGATYADILDALRIECGSAVLDEAERAGAIPAGGKGFTYVALEPGTSDRSVDSVPTGGVQCRIAARQSGVARLGVRHVDFHPALTHMTIIQFLAARFRAGLSGDGTAAALPAPPREPLSIEGDLGGGPYRMRTAEQRRYERDYRRRRAENQQLAKQEGSRRRA